MRRLLPGIVSIILLALGRSSGVDAALTEDQLHAAILTADDVSQEGIGPAMVRAAGSVAGHPYANTFVAFDLPRYGDEVTVYLWDATAAGSLGDSFRETLEHTAYGSRVQEVQAAIAGQATRHLVAERNTSSGRRRLVSLDWEYEGIGARILMQTVDDEVLGSSRSAVWAADQQFRLITAFSPRLVASSPEEALHAFHRESGGQNDLLPCESPASGEGSTGPCYRLQNARGNVRLYAITPTCTEVGRWYFVALVESGWRVAKSTPQLQDEPSWPQCVGISAHRRFRRSTRSRRIMPSRSPRTALGA